MNLPPADGEGSTDSTARSEPEARVGGPRIDRKELDEVFGDVLPDTTGGERDSGEPIGERSQEWYQENRPPHHGG
jgi:hypothetical protein